MGKKGKQSNATDLAVKVVSNETLSAIDDLFSSVKGKKKRSSNNETGSAIDEDQQSFNTDKDSTKKKKKLRVAPVEEEEELGSSSMPYGLIQSKYNSISIINPEAPLERIDMESGLPVYKAHLLKVGEGGGTELCPFDCNCCF
jgi:hypothetical protein